MKTTIPNLKLTCELIPSSVWGDNLRNTIPKSEWDNLRQKTLTKASHTCEICKSTQSPLHCHELWKFNDTHHTLILTNLQSLCQNCHNIKHIGYINTTQPEKIPHLAQHFIKVNKTTLSTFNTHINESSTKWKKRNKHTWSVDMSKYLKNQDDS